VSRVEQRDFVDVVHALAARRGAVTHLKLQKLAFYAYGSVVARDLFLLVEPLTFEAWQHGPVHLGTWNRYRGSGKAALASPSIGRVHEVVVEAVADVTDVYGRLDAWELREQSHREAPWKSAFDAGTATIDPDEFAQHFTAKFAGEFAPPSALGSASAALDGIPPPAFASLAAFASALRAHPA